MQLADYLDQGAFANADGACLISDGSMMTYREVQDLSHQIANGLAANQFGKDDKIAILSPNDPYAFISVLGLSRVGATWVPINPRNGLDENHYILDSFDCSALIYHSVFEPLVASLRPRLPKLKLLLCLDKTGQDCEHFMPWLEQYDATPVSMTSSSEDVALLAGTGGTTGKPKGVMLSNQNMETLVSLSLFCTPKATKPVYLALAPMTHAAGVLVFPVLALGGATVIMPKPDLAAFLSLIETYNVTTTFLPPTLIYMLLDHPALASTNLSSLQYFWYGAAPMSAEKLKQSIEVFGPVMTQLYGQTEAPMLLTHLSAEDHFSAENEYAEQRLRSCGRPTPLVKVAIMDDDGILLPTDKRGEIVVKSSLVMQGYYKNEAATASTIKNGWLHTGDIGYFDDEGYLYLVDRKRDVIISGGFNVYSVEVEDAIMQLDAIQDCAVIGLPHKKWGEMVVAVVQLRQGQTVKESDLIDYCKAQLGSVKAPKQVVVMDDLPRSTVGKVLKRSIRQQLTGDASVFKRD